MTIVGVSRSDRCAVHVSSVTASLQTWLAQRRYNVNQMFARRNGKRSTRTISADKGNRRPHTVARRSHPTDVGAGADPLPAVPAEPCREIGGFGEGGRRTPPDLGTLPGTGQPVEKLRAVVDKVWISRGSRSRSPVRTSRRVNLRSSTDARAPHTRDLNRLPEKYESVNVPREGRIASHQLWRLRGCPGGCSQATSSGDGNLWTEPALVSHASCSDGQDRRRPASFLG